MNQPSDQSHVGDVAVMRAAINTINLLNPEQRENALAAIDRLEKRVAELKAEVSEWLCQGCRTVYPGPPQAGTGCVVCPRCGGDTQPRLSADRDLLAQQLATSEQQVTFHQADAHVARQQLATAREAMESVAHEIVPQGKEACHVWSFNDYNYAQVRLRTLEKWAKELQQALSAVAPPSDTGAPTPHSPDMPPSP